MILCRSGGDGILEWMKKEQMEGWLGGWIDIQERWIYELCIVKISVFEISVFSLPPVKKEYMKSKFLEKNILYL